MNFTRQRLERLRELKRRRPQFAEIFEFYENLYQFLDAQTEPFLTVRPDAASAQMKSKEGFPLITGADLRVDQEKTTAFLRKLTDILLEKGHQGKEELSNLAQALDKGKLHAAPLIQACLDRNRQTLDEGALRVEVSPALLEYVLDTALSFALQQAREQGLGAPAEGWNHGYCPLCGGIPAMGEITDGEGGKLLHCAVCATSWSYPRLRCSYCGNADPDTLEYFTAEGEEGHRVDICRKCSCYLKVADTRGITDERPMDIEDVSTLHLDLLAQKEGFTRGKKGTT